MYSWVRDLRVSKGLSINRIIDHPDPDPLVASLFGTFDIVYSIPLLTKVSITASRDSVNIVPTFGLVVSQ